MLDMLRKLILPACVKYSKEVAEGVAIKKQIGVDAPAEAALVRTITEKTAALAQAERTLTEKAAGVPERSIARIRARYYRDEVLPAMEEARRIADELEGLVAKDAWPMPTYSDILFYI